MSSLAPSSCASTCGSSNAYAKGGRNAALLDNIIQCNGFAAREPAFKLFSKIATNILEHPTEIKYRKLNVEKVMSKFGAFVGIAELMKSVGFVAEEDGRVLVLPESTETASLCAALCAWTDREKRSADARAEAEKIRQENMKDVSADKARKDAHRAELKSLGQQARADVAAKPINDSRPNAIKFGSTLVKAPPPPPAAKGG